MGRSIKKGPFIQEALLKRVQAMNAASTKKVVKTWSRSSTVIPEFVGHTFAVHNGNKFIPVWSGRRCRTGGRSGGASEGRAGQGRQVTDEHSKP